jgi:hypothetical protein
MLVSAAAMYGVGASSAFAYRTLEIGGARYTDEAAIAGALDEVRGDNLFRISTAPLEDILRRLSTVSDVRVGIRLPETMTVTLEERQPILIWRVGAREYLTDIDGALFARLGEERPEAAAGLPVVEDHRASSAGLSVGVRLDPVDLDAATRIASLVPSDVGSAAASLRVIVNDEHGFVVRARPQGWSAVFGFYTASLRPTSIVAGQVRLLRSLLIGREPLIERIVLADERDGTYVERPTPRPIPSARPSP